MLLKFSCPCFIVMIVMRQKILPSILNNRRTNLIMQNYIRVKLILLSFFNNYFAITHFKKQKKASFTILFSSLFFLV
jgi:hypothetical protein